MEVVDDGAESVVVFVFGFVVPFFEQPCGAGNLTSYLWYSTLLFLYDGGFGRGVSRFIFPGGVHLYPAFRRFPATKEESSNCAKC